MIFFVQISFSCKRKTKSSLWFFLKPKQTFLNKFIQRILKIILYRKLGKTKKKKKLYLTANSFPWNGFPHTRRTTELESKWNFLNWLLIFLSTLCYVGKIIYNLVMQLYIQSFHYEWIRLNIVSILVHDTEHIQLWA